MRFYPAFPFLVALITLSVSCAPVEFAGGSGRRPDAPPPAPSRTKGPIDVSDPNQDPSEPRNPTFDGERQVPSPQPYVDPTNPGHPSNPGQPGSKLPPGAVPETPDTPDQTIKKPVTYSCATPDNPVRPIVYVEQSMRDAVVVEPFKAEVCPGSFNFLKVAIMVDVSSSMGPHFSPVTGADHKGNDPLTDNSCNRARALDAVIQRLEVEAKNGATIEVAIFTFSDNVVNQYRGTLGGKSGAKPFIKEQALASDKVCGFVHQAEYAGRPGGIAPTDSYGTGTKFAPPLDATRQFFAGGFTRNVAYLITDGEATDQAASEQAARSVASIRNTTINSVQLAHDAQNAKQFLGALSKKGRLVQISDMSQLAQTITSFEPPEIIPQSVRARVLVFPHPARELPVTTIVGGSLPGSVTVDATRGFFLLGVPDYWVSNFVIITGQATDGSRHMSTVEIRYKQTVP